MALEPHTQLGPYEIVMAIGAGGMGEVYKARDTRLNRTVAIKVLPEHISRDGQAKQRFEREAQMVAGLNHPNICVLHDVGQHEGIDFLVMEYLEGVTLADRLVKGFLPLGEAVKIAMEVADALDKAHRTGVIHRDLKPGNIMLTEQGAKLLDFGLAKVAHNNSGAAFAASSAPTEEASLTEIGTVLGTLPYMAPEQIEGQNADARSDIFAFGAVLYEMVTGRRTFQGKSRASLMSAILSLQPPAPSTIISKLPPALDHVIERCLAKDPADRWQSARDLWLELKSAGDPTNPLIRTATASKPNRYAWIVSAVLAVGLLAAAIPAVRYFRSPPPTSPTMRFEIPTSVAGPYLISMAISPDGSRVAYVAPAGPGGGQVLWVRPLNSLEARMLPGTEGARTPFWSSDSRFIAFDAVPGPKLMKIDANGGPPQTLVENLGPNGGRRGDWNRDGTILFNGPAIRRISESGGEATDVTELDESLGEVFHATPSFLPDGRHFLYAAWSTQPENRAIYIGSLDSKDRTRLMPAESKAVYVQQGYVLFLRARTLMARPFDANRLEFTGEAAPLAEQIAQINEGGAAAFSASQEGTLIYRHGDGPGTIATRQWTWMDRSGKITRTMGAPQNANNLQLSPDDKQIVFFEGSAGNAADLWIYDMDRDVRTRLTTDPATDVFPVWSPDGSRLVFASQRSNDNTIGLYEKPSNGAVPEQVFLPSESGVATLPRDWSLDGRHILLERAPGLITPTDLWALPLSGDRKPFPYLVSSFDETLPALSPNGRWLAYVSNESGRYQVIVQPFPDASGGKWQISTSGGHFPRWRRDGRELYYLDPDRRIIAVSVIADDKFEVGKSTPLFTAALNFPTTATQPIPYDVAADGQRFLVSALLLLTPAPNSSPITVVVNWPSALEK